jgi:peptide/nickel transport system substrate-binding protein
VFGELLHCSERVEGEKYMQHRVRLMLHLGLILVVLAVAFSGGIVPCRAELPQSEYGGKLVYAIPGNPDSLDPQATTGTLTFQFIKSAYDTLLEPDASGKLVPALAESWTFSDEDLTLTFTLRRGVKFNNGKTLTAADVKATFDRLLAPDSTSPYKPRFSAVEAVIVLDDSSVQFKLKELYMPLLATLGCRIAAREK